MLLLLLAPTAAAQPAREATITAQPVMPGALPPLPYWPFTAHSVDDPPLLTRVDVDAKVTPTGCGALTWSTHPVPGAVAAGPFCVAVLDGLSAPLLVVGRPGAAPYILAPGTVSTAVDDDGTRAMRIDAPSAPLPAVVEAVRRWAANPGGMR